MSGFEGSRAFMLGLDGLSQAFIESPIVQDSMPALLTFLKRARPRSLMSTTPPYTGPAWTTITTGMEPGKHGVFGFTDREGRPVSDREVSVPRIWERLDEVDGRALVVNVPLTHPPRRINGTLIAGMPAPAGRPYTSPEDLVGKIQGFAPGYVVDVSIVGSPQVAGTVKALTAMTEARGRALAHLLQKESWDLALAVFVLPDRLGHPWWKYLVPGSPLYETRRGKHVRSTARTSLQALDNAIEDALAALPAGTLVVLCSDHGFGPLDADIFFDAELAKAGLLTPGSSRLRRWASRAGRSRVAAAVPRVVLEGVKRRVEKDPVGRVAWTAPKFEHAIRLADPADAATEQRVVELLTALRSPTGNKVVERVRRRDEIFQGENVERAPELFPEMVSESIELHDGFHSNTWLSRARSAWGTHAREGVFAIDTQSPLPDRADAADIGTTLLGALGIEIEGSDGNNLVKKDVVHRLGWRERGRDEGSAYDADEEAAVMEHLRGLGYVE